MNSNNARYTDRMKAREANIGDIVAEVADEVDTVLLFAPDCLTDEDREGIRDEVIAYTRFVTEALTAVEIENPGARRAHVLGAIRSAEHLINVRLARQAHA